MPRPSTDPRERPARPVPAWLQWLVPPLMLASTLGGVAWVMRGPQGLWGYVVAFLFLIALGWIMTSVLWPSRADRTCPECGSEELIRLDQSTTIGIRCSACDFVDDSASSWYMAEEEGPLEELVLAQRKARREARHRQQTSPALQPHCEADDSKHSEQRTDP